MHLTNLWQDLQLFADGGTGDGGGGAGAGPAETGVGAADPGRQRLLDLGVPADRIRDKASKAVSGKMAKADPEEATQTAAAKDAPEEEAKTKPTWKELMQDPDYSREMQRTVQARLRTAKAAEEAMGKLAPALEVLARAHGMDISKLDYDALAKAINDDNAYYEDKALKMGVSVEQAKSLDQAERDLARRQRQEQITLEEKKFQDHLQALEQQAEELKKVFPNFDLRQELKDPQFARLVRPDSGLSLQAAFHALHYKEIQAAAAQAAAEKTAQKMANAIQSGTRRPREAGTGSNAPSVTSFDYRQASREQREALKARIRRGEKIYPGQV